jgi:hypothetical protein
LSSSDLARYAQPAGHGKAMLAATSSLSHHKRTYRRGSGILVFNYTAAERLVVPSEAGQCSAGATDSCEAGVLSRSDSY